MVDKEDIVYTKILDLFEDIDSTVCAKICRNELMFNHMFVLHRTNTRQGTNILPKEIARKTAIHNLFAWRQSARYHGSVNVSYLHETPLNKAIIYYYKHTRVRAEIVWGRIYQMNHETLVLHSFFCNDRGL